MAAGEETFLSKNILGILSFVFSMVTAIGASWTMQVRHDEKIAAAEFAIRELKSDMNDKVDQAEFKELKSTLNEMRGDIKDLLKVQANRVNR